MSITSDESFELEEPVVLYLATPLRRGVRNYSNDKRNIYKVNFPPELGIKSSMTTVITCEQKLNEINQQKETKENSLKENIQKENIQKEIIQKENIQKENNQKENNQKENNQKENLQKENNQKENNQKENNQKENLQKENNQKEIKKNKFPLQRNRSQNIINPFKDGLPKHNKNENINKCPQTATHNNISIINNSINYFNINCNKENTENITQKFQNVASKKYSDNDVAVRNKNNNINNNNDNQNNLNKSIISISEASDENNNDEKKKKNKKLKNKNYKSVKKEENNENKQKIFIDDPDNIIARRKKSCFNPSKSKNGGPLIPILTNINYEPPKKNNKEKEKYKPKIMNDDGDKTYHRKVSKNIIETKNEKKKNNISNHSSKNSLPIENNTKKQTTKSKEKFQLQLSKIKTEKAKEKFNYPSNKRGKEKTNKITIQLSKNNKNNENEEENEIEGGSRRHKKKIPKEMEQEEKIRNEKRSSTLKVNKSQFQSDDKRKSHEQYKKNQNKLHSTNKVSIIAQTKSIYMKNNINNKKDDSDESNKDEKKIKKSKKSKPKTKLKSKKKSEEEFFDNNNKEKDNHNNNHSSRSSLDIKKVKPNKNTNTTSKEKEKSNSKNELTNKMNFQQKIYESNSNKTNPLVDNKTNSSSIFSCKTMKDSKIKKILEENTKKVENRLSCENQNPEIEPFTNTEIKKDSNTTDYKEYTFNCLELILDLEKEKKEIITSKINFNFTTKKKKIALFDIDETLIHCTGNVKTKGNVPHQKEIYISLPNNQKVKVGINIRPYWKEALDMIIDKYNIVAFTASHQAYADSVLESIDPENKYFKYRLYRNNCALKIFNGNKLYIKDLDILKDNYNLKDVVIIDNSVLSFAYHLNNGIPIVPYYDRKDDEYLILIAIYLSKIAECYDLREKNKQIYNLEGMKQEIADDLEESVEKSSSGENLESSSEKNENSCLKKNKDENINNKNINKNNNNNEKKNDNKNENNKKKINENVNNNNNEEDKKVKKLSSDSDLKKVDSKNTNIFNRKGSRRKSEDFGELSNNVDKKSQMFKIYADFGKEKSLKPDILKEEYNKGIIEEVDEESQTERDKEQHTTPQSSKGINNLHEENNLEKNNKKSCRTPRNENMPVYHSDNDEKEEIKINKINVIKEMPKVNKKPLKAMKSVNWQTNLNFFNGFSQNAKMTVVSNQLDILLSDK